MNPPLTYLIVFFVSFVLCLLITPLIRRVALKGNLVAVPRDDRWHKRPTALLGGVSLFVTLMAAWQLAFLQLDLYSAVKHLVPLALGCLAIFLLGLAVATSIDALAVGFSLAMMRAAIWIAAIVIAIVTSALSAIAVAAGRRAGVRWGRWAELAGGAILCAIGVRIVLEHTAGSF